MKIELDIVPLNNWLHTENKPMLIAGPCSAESDEQIITTAKEIAKHFPENIFRAGVWKPRTRPNSFEGMGEKALESLQKVKSETGMKTTTEVATARHVELCLKYGIDILWIGARTTGNPFSVQEIADALQGVDIPVLVKNPLNPDLQLWIGALERINKAGIKKIIAVHRGFHTTEKTPFRYSPQWNIPIELKTLLPQLPIFCDVSHITGDRNLIQIISQEAMNLNMEGLMIETHINPDAALSDAKQQVTPQQLYNIVSQLQIRKPISEDTVFKTKMEELRLTVDKLNSELLKLLSQRMKISEEIAYCKKENNVAIFQVDRWRKTINEVVEQGKLLGLNENFLKGLFSQIHSESIKKQAEIMDEKIDYSVLGELFK